MRTCFHHFLPAEEQAGETITNESCSICEANARFIRANWPTTATHADGSSYPLEEAVAFAANLPHLATPIQSAGGRARAKSMTKAERSQSARRAARARWGKPKRRE